MIEKKEFLETGLAGASKNVFVFRRCLI